jgi:hypothetical protein
LRNHRFSSSNGISEHYWSIYIIKNPEYCLFWSSFELSALLSWMWSDDEHLRIWRNIQWKLKVRSLERWVLRALRNDNWQSSANDQRDRETSRKRTKKEIELWHLEMTVDNDHLWESSFALTWCAVLCLAMLGTKYQQKTIKIFFSCCLFTIVHI